MILLLVVAGVLLVALQVRYDMALSRLLEAHAAAEQTWMLERSELVTRAMHPQVVLPPRHMQPAALPEPAIADDFELVGRILTEDEA